MTSYKKGSWTQVGTGKSDFAHLGKDVSSEFECISGEKIIYSERGEYLLCDHFGTRGQESEWDQVVMLLGNDKKSAVKNYKNGVADGG